MIRTLLKEVKEYKAASIATPFFMILEVLFETLIPFLMASIIGCQYRRYSPYLQSWWNYDRGCILWPACRNGRRTIRSKGFDRVREEFEK